MMTAARGAGPAATARFPAAEVAALAALAVLMGGGAACAHVVRGANGFASGFEHPLTGLDHLLAMLSVGIWGAQMGGRSVWTLPVTFPLVMVLGGLAGMLALPLPSVELGIALSIVVLGSAIALAWRPPEIVALVLVGVFAIFHGYAHGAELPLAADPTRYAVGFVLATGMIHLAGIAVGLALSRPFGGLPARLLGGAVVAGGLFYLLG